MAKNVTQYDLLISCPGDVQSEVEIIKQIIDDFNERYSDTLGISLRARHWKKSSYAQSGGKPQALLNEQFVKQCDAAVAVFWTRFGTPTDEYGSGSEEEIELMLGADKQVFMYFSDRPTPPSAHNPAEYERINAFREKYKDRGIYFTYTSDEEFTKLFTAHLAQHFLSIQKVNEIKDLRAPRLLLRGINENGMLWDSVPVHSFVLNFERKADNYIEAIKQMYQDIAALQVSSYATKPFRSNSLAEGYLESFYPPITITDKRKKILTRTASVFNLSLPDNFFELGNLAKDGFGGDTILGQHRLRGTENEKKKYELIQSLYDTIIEYSKQSRIEEAFSNMKCLKFAVENDGTAVDEDVEITITLSKHDLLAINEFPELNNSLKDYLLNEINMDELFGIPSTAQYMEYESSMKPLSGGNYAQPTSINTFPFINGEADYSEDYEDELFRIFSYDIYPSGEDCICKLKIDYIKHHTVVAFPTPLLLKGIPTEIPYTITSKNAAEIIRGTIKVSTNTGND